MDTSPDQIALHVGPTPLAGRVAGDVAFGMALRCGFGPLAAERVRGAVRAAVEGAPGARLEARAASGRLSVVLSGADDGWRRRAAETLAAHGPIHADGRVEVVFRGASRSDLRPA